MCVVTCIVQYFIVFRHLYLTPLPIYKTKLHLLCALLRWCCCLRRLAVFSSQNSLETMCILIASDRSIVRRSVFSESENGNESTQYYTFTHSHTRCNGHHETTMCDKHDTDNGEEKPAKTKRRENRKEHAGNRDVIQKMRNNISICLMLCHDYNGFSMHAGWTLNDYSTMCKGPI